MEGNLLGIVQQIEIWPYQQMVHVKTKIRQREWDIIFFFNFTIQMNHVIQARRTDFVIIHKKGELTV